MLLTQRRLMTEADRQDHLFKYSSDNDNRVSPQEYKVRVGAAIRTLREELPQFFQHGLCTTSIYASNIRLIEASHTNVSLQGKPIYFLLAGAVRWSFKMWFRDIEFEIQSVRVSDRGGRGLKGMDFGGDRDNISIASFDARNHCTREPAASNIVRSLDFTHRHRSPSNNNGVDAISLSCIDKLEGTLGPGEIGEGGMEDGESSLPPATTVTVRWTMKGTTRPSVVLTSSGPSAPPPSSYAGVFVYQFNEHGLIDEHRIENIMPSPSPEAIKRAFAWWGWLLSKTHPAAAAAAASDGNEARKRLELGC
ncbi:hypothetical protein EDD11_003800 [Mortierella claussenii]|nr:hypothetical protein EDD11_003800 [Mortierella claussenii]